MFHVSNYELISVISFRSSLFDAPTRLQIEQRYGPQPAELSAFSLWMTAITPFPELTKAMWLRSKDTKGRLKACIEAMTDLLTSSQLREAQTDEGLEEEDAGESEESMEVTEMQPPSSGIESS